MTRFKSNHCNFTAGCLIYNLLHNNNVVLVWSLNAKFEADRDTADKSAKLCPQFPWDMSIKSEMGAQEKTSCYRIKWEILFIIVLMCLVTTLFLKIVFATVLKGKMAVSYTHLTLPTKLEV